MDFLKYVIDNNLGEIVNNFDSKNITTIKTSSIIRTLFYPNSIDSLAFAFKFINDFNLKYFIIGNGSNVIFKNESYDGIVISLKFLSKEINVDSNYVVASSNINLNSLILRLSKINKGGFEELIGIPGTIGGAIVQNAGACGKEIKDCIKSAKFINSLGKIEEIKAEELLFKYRYSLFKDIKGIIIEATFYINQSFNSKELIRKYLSFRKCQPINQNSMGSVFKNPFGIKAWEVISKLKIDKYNGEAFISDIHSNFIINKKNATSKNVLDLLFLIKKEAFLQMGIVLEEEIIIIE